MKDNNKKPRHKVGTQIRCKDICVETIIATPSIVKLTVKEKKEIRKQEVLIWFKNLITDVIVYSIFAVAILFCLGMIGVCLQILIDSSCS